VCVDSHFNLTQIPWLFGTSRSTFNLNRLLHPPFVPASISSPADDDEKGCPVTRHPPVNSTIVGLHIMLATLENQWIDGQSPMQRGESVFSVPVRKTDEKRKISFYSICHGK